LAPSTRFHLSAHSQPKRQLRAPRQSHADPKILTRATHQRHVTFDQLRPFTPPRPGCHLALVPQNAEVVAVGKQPGDVDLVLLGEVRPAARPFTAASAVRSPYTMFSVSRKRLAS
jgi:hypothetical protein